MIYACIIPTIAATYLYTLAIVQKDNNLVLLVGFILWLGLVIMNIIRVIIEWKKSKQRSKNTCH